MRITPATRRPFGTQYRTTDTPCPCGDGTITAHYAVIPGRRRGHPDTWEPDEIEDGPVTPCEACGCTDADACDHAPECGQ